MRKTVFIKNAAVLTVSSAVIKLIGIYFKIYLGRTAGSEGMGLYQLVFSFYMLACAFAGAGIVTAVTRLCADELSAGSKKGIYAVIVKSLTVTLSVAFLTSILIYFNSDFIARLILKDSRTTASLKIIPFVFPFMGVSAVFRGYFIARRNASPAAISQLVEQLCRIAFTVTVFENFTPDNIKEICAAVLLADIAAHLAGCMCIMIFFFFDKKRISSLCERNPPPFKAYKKILHISLPITLSRYAVGGLRSAENILVPLKLSLYSSEKNALSFLGEIKGMALPLLLFPSSLLSALSTMLIPEISEAFTQGKKYIIRTASQKTVKITVLSSLFFAALFAAAGKELGIFLFKSESTGFLISALSPLVPLMYLDSICDGMLKGMDQQGFCFTVSVSDSALRILLIILLLPSLGARGFIFIMYFSNIFTSILNVGRLLKISEAGIDTVKSILLPTAAAVGAVFPVFFIIRRLSANIPLNIIITAAMGAAAYLAFLFLLDCVSGYELKAVFKSNR